MAAVDTKNKIQSMRVLLSSVVELIFVKFYAKLRSSSYIPKPKWSVVRVSQKALSHLRLQTYA